VGTEKEVQSTRKKKVVEYSHAKPGQKVRNIVSCSFEERKAEL